MTTKNGASLDSIYEILVSTADRVGTIDGRTIGLESNMEILRDSVQKQGTAIGDLQQTCALRGREYETRFKRLSGDVAVVKEDTGVLHIDDLKRRVRWQLIAKIGAGLIAAIGAAVGCVKIFG